MGDNWDEAKKAREEEYFHKQNQEALERLNKRSASESSKRISPITGEPMEQTTFMGVIIDRCKKSGGVWLDQGELEMILENIQSQDDAEQKSLFEDFFSFFKK